MYDIIAVVGLEYKYQCGICKLAYGMMATESM